MRKKVTKMVKCIACGKSVLLSTDFGNHSLCKTCASKVNASAWKNRDVASIGELITNKNNALLLANQNGFSGDAVSAIEKYFDAYINAGYVTTINGKVGQVLKVFGEYCIIDTKNEEKKSELASLFYYFTDDDEDDEEDDRSIFEKEKDSIVKGLLTGKIVQTGIGLAASAVIDTQGKEKADERKSRERRKKREKMIVVGEERINLVDFSQVDTYLIPDTAKGYLRFIPKGVAPNDYFACTYFFFNASNPFERKKIKAHMDSVRDMLNKKIVTIAKAQEKLAMETRMAQEATARNNMSVETVNNKDAFEEIRKYKGLLDEGIITEEEFNKMKKELLGL